MEPGKNGKSKFFAYPIYERSDSDPFSDEEEPDLSCFRDLEPSCSDDLSDENDLWCISNVRSNFLKTEVNSPALPGVSRSTGNFKHKRKKLVIAALWTEVCGVGPALSAIEEGYEVYFVTDASGGVSKLRVSG